MPWVIGEAGSYQLRSLASWQDWTAPGRSRLTTAGALRGVSSWRISRAATHRRETERDLLQSSGGLMIPGARRSAARQPEVGGDDGREVSVSAPSLQSHLRRYDHREIDLRPRRCLRPAEQLGPSDDAVRASSDAAPISTRRVFGPTSSGDARDARARAYGHSTEERSAPIARPCGALLRILAVDTSTTRCVYPLMRRALRGDSSKGLITHLKLSVRVVQSGRSSRCFGAGTRGR